MQRLRDPELRLVDEFFWFWPHKLGEGREDPALVSLARGEEKKAVEIWERQEHYHAERNVSMHNLAVLSHVTALDLELAATSKRAAAAELAVRAGFWRAAFLRWKILLAEEGFWSLLTARIREFEDPRLTTGTARRMRNSLPLALLLINAQLAVRAAEGGDFAEAQRHLAIMRESGFGEEVVREALRRAIEPIRERIKTLCQTAEREADADRDHADAVSRKLAGQTRPLLGALDCLLPTGNPTRDGAHDEVALRALSCQIAFGNKTDNWRVSEQLLEEVLAVVASSSARSRIEENLRVVRSNRAFGTCFFCGQNDSADSAEVEVKMYGEVVRTPTWNGVRITWKKLSVKVPRCESCKSAQGKVGNWAGLGALVGVLAGLAGCIPLASADNPGGGFIVFVACLGAGIGVAYGLAKSRFGKGIRSAGEKNNFPKIQELVKQGWTFGDGPSQ
jgi:hypothetical protein